MIRGKKRQLHKGALAVLFAGTFCMLALLSAYAGTGEAPTQSQPPIPLVPDSSIVMGHLDNGLSYFLKGNNDPKDRLLLRLVVKAGSLEETDAERGVAHFLEHMAFRGTRSFPENSIVRFMESIGMEFGAEVNAYTGFDSTVYDLEIPSHDPEALKQAMAVLRDWADGITIDQAAVDRERGVVLEEERRGHGADDRVWHKHVPAVYGDSLYARREPIGTVESIRAQSAASIRAFYERWYRPELMAVIVVGDAPTADVAKALGSAFASLAAKQGPQTSPRALPQRAGVRSSVATDPELGRSTLEFGARIPLIVSRTEADFIQNGMLNVALDALSDRFNEVVRRSGGEELAGASFGTYEPANDALFLYGDASFKGGAWKPAAKTMLAEIDRVIAHGFSEEEVSRIRDDYFADFENWKKNGITSDDWCARLDRFYEKGVIPVSVDDRIRMYKKLFEALKPEDLTRYATLLRNGKEKIELLSLPESTAPVPTSEELESAINERSADLGKWATAAVPTSIMAVKPVPVAPTAVVDDAPTGITRLAYANGVTVLLKRTALKPDEIAMSAMAQRGSDSLDESAYANAAFAASLIPGSGFSGLSPDALTSLVAGKTLSLRAGIGSRYITLRGGSDQKDLESLLQLVRRTMADPVVDPGYLAAARGQVADYGRNFQSKPENLLQLEISTSLFPGLDRLAMFSKEEDAARLDGEAMRKAFASLFSSPEGFCFCFSGSFDPDALRSLCDTYLGSIPKEAALAATPISHKLSPEAQTRTVRAGSENKAQVVMVFKTPDSATDTKTVNGLDAVAEALSRSLLDRMRREKGATYDVSAQALTDTDNAFSVITVSFGTSPERAEELVGLVRDETARLAKEGVSDSTLKEIVLAFEKDLEKNAGQNGYLASEIARSFSMGEGLDPVGSTKADLDALTAEWIKAAAARYLDASRLAVFTLLPAASK